jgi:hypothetical protein
MIEYKQTEHLSFVVKVKPKCNGRPKLDILQMFLALIDIYLNHGNRYHGRKCRIFHVNRGPLTIRSNSNENPWSLNKQSKQMCQVIKPSDQEKNSIL